MAALKDHNAPETKVCNACGLPRAREAYGSKQWKARSVRRCTECAAADRPVRAKAPPVPTAPAPAPARRSNALTQEEKESAERLRDGAPMTYKIRRDWSAAAPSFVMPRVSSGSEPELRRLGRNLGLRMNAKHYFAEDNDEEESTEVLAADLSLAGVKFAFDRTVYVLEGCDMGTVSLICCIRKGRPFIVFKVGAGEHSGCDAEASAAEIEQLSRKLGLERASPAELVATILAAVCPNLLSWPRFYCDDYDGGYFDVSPENNPILTEAIGMLSDPWRRRGSDKPEVPPKSGAQTSFRDMLAGVISAEMREVSSSDSDDGGESDAFIENPFHPENVRVFSFMEEWRPRVEAQEPSLTYGQVGLRLANIWRSLSDAQKAKYKKPQGDDETATEPEAALSPSDDETATFKRASEETLRQRRIVSVSGRFKGGGAPAAAKSPHTSDDDPDDASLDLGPEPRQEATQNSIEVKDSDELKRMLDVVARFQANDPTLVDDYKAGLMEIARRHQAAQKASGAGVEEEKTEDDATAARTEARLERSLARRRCDICGLQAANTERPFQVCNGCRGRRYCSRACQKADWASHKQSCAGYNPDV